MNAVLRSTIFVIGLLFILYTFYLLINKRVTEKSSLIWIFGSLLVFVVSAWPQLLNRLASAVGVSYPPSLLYLVAIIVLFATNLYQSIQIATLDQKYREIGRAVALLENRVSHADTPHNPTKTSAVVDQDSAEKKS